MQVKTKIAGLIVALTALSMPLVYADNGPGPMPGDAPMYQDGNWHHGGDGDHMMAKILGLSDDQVKQLKDLHKQQREAMKDIFKQVKTDRQAFDAEIVKANPDMNKITDLQNQLKTIATQMVDSRLNSLLSIKKILTPEQFAGYMALKKEREMRMMHKMHGKFGPKPGFDKDGHQWGDGDHDQD